MKGADLNTCVTKKNGSLMHFDIIAPSFQKEASVIYGYGKAYFKPEVGIGKL
ncbi:MAG: DUF2024 family protein [Bacteroidia bacterium]|nr:DUF2024 family protein [Bacteroidia bacterium]